MRTYPFLGKGLSWPLRVDRNTGDLEKAQGYVDDLSVSIAFLADRWTIREPLDVRTNLIGDAVANIILTSPLEHDTLPEYGSHVHKLLFEPNTLDTYDTASYYFASATKRWEYRVNIDEDTGVQWSASGKLIDEGGAHCRLIPKFIKEQTGRNLVLNFVTPRQAREAEYPKGNITPESIYDWVSRYKDCEIFIDNATEQIRLKFVDVIGNAPDDEFYEVRPGDTWFLVAHKTLGDNRLWWVLLGAYIHDMVTTGGTRDSLDTRITLVPGELLRVPQRSRILLGNIG